MSDSEPLPSDAAISQKLQDVVVAIYHSGNNDELTVKRVRKRAESELGLDDGFLKAHSIWKAKSQKVIEDAVVGANIVALVWRALLMNTIQNTHCVSDSTPEPSPQKATKPKPKAKPKPAESKPKTVAPSKGVKRKAGAPTKSPKKRRKAESQDNSESQLSEISDNDSAPPPKRTTKPVKRPTVAEDSDDEPAATSPAKAKDDASDSDMSSLIDESPKPKSKQKKESIAKGKKASKPVAPKAKAAKAQVDDDPDAAQVKQLQGWLVKCGIRKVWSRDPDLAKCDTNKEKISVLKRMLKDVGMDGKYSVEKAAKIKEKREFQKDLAAIQEAEAHWGATEDTGGRPRRRAAAVAAAAKPQQKLVLSDDSEGHESGGNDNASSDDDDDDEDVDDDDDDNAKETSDGGDNSDDDGSN